MLKRLLYEGQRGPFGVLLPITATPLTLVEELHIGKVLGKKVYSDVSRAVSRPFLPGIGSDRACGRMTAVSVSKCNMALAIKRSLSLDHLIP